MTAPFASNESLLPIVFHTREGWLPDDIAQRLQARWGDVARYVLECVAWAWYQSGELNEEELQRFLGYDTRLQVHVFLRQHGLPLRDTVVNQKPTQRSQRNST